MSIVIGFVAMVFIGVAFKVLFSIIGAAFNLLVDIVVGLVRLVSALVFNKVTLFIVIMYLVYRFGIMYYM